VANAIAAGADRNAQPILLPPPLQLRCHAASNAAVTAAATAAATTASTAAATAASNTAATAAATAASTVAATAADTGTSTAAATAAFTAAAIAASTAASTAALTAAATAAATAAEARPAKPSPFCCPQSPCPAEANPTSISPSTAAGAARNAEPILLPTTPLPSEVKYDFDFTDFFGALYQLTAEILPFDINHCFGRLFGVLCFVSPRFCS
jgi:hypothetical protein